MPGIDLEQVGYCRVKAGEHIVILKQKPVWVSAQRCNLGENPLWDADASTLYWINIADPWVYRMRDGVVREYACPKPVGSIYLASGGARMLVAMRPQLAWLDLETGVLTQIDVDVGLDPDERYNDGRCDRSGALWVSTLDRRVSRPLGSIVRFGPGFHGTATPSQAVIGNGICFSGDDERLYFSDSRGRAIYRYGKSAGELADRQLFAALDAAPGRPDGCTVDAEGCLWSARIGGGCIDRYLPDGRLIDKLELPVADPTHCTFGGPDLSTLFVTTASGHSGETSGDGALQGAVLAFEMDVRGMPEHRLHPDYAWSGAQSA